MDEKEASQTAAALLKLMRTGNDARTQVDFICNTLRIKKKSATHLQEIFESGVRAGCDAVINGKKDLELEGQVHPLYLAAYQLGGKDFISKLEEQRQKHKPKSILRDYKLILLTVLILLLIIIFYL